MLLETTFYIFAIIALIVHCLILYLVISSATKSSKQVYNQEMQVFLLKKIVQLLESNNKTAGIVKEDGGGTDLNNPDTLEKLLSVLPKK